MAVVSDWRRPWEGKREADEQQERDKHNNINICDSNIKALSAQKLQRRANRWTTVCGNTRCYVALSPPLSLSHSISLLSLSASLDATIFFLFKSVPYRRTTWKLAKAHFVRTMHRNQNWSARECSAAISVLVVVSACVSGLDHLIRLLMHRRHSLNVAIHVHSHEPIRIYRCPHKKTQLCATSYTLTHTLQSTFAGYVAFALNVL